MIYPPVDVDRFATVAPVRGEYFLTWGRLVASKRVDLAIRAAAIAGVSLVVAGEPARMRLDCVGLPGATSASWEG